jgi:hypothetical protein
MTGEIGRIQGVTSFGEDRSGNLYVVTSTTVKRIRA